jgi:predicted transcriptional regulator
MLQLHSARTRLISMLHSAHFQHSSVSSKTIELLGSYDLVVLSESITVGQAAEQFRSLQYPGDGIVYSDHNEIVGILRRESVERIVKEQRDDALALPITSLVTRSYTMVDQSMTWKELLEKIKDERALSLIVRRGGIDRFGITVDMVLVTLTGLIFEEDLEYEYPRAEANQRFRYV